MTAASLAATGVARAWASNHEFRIFDGLCEFGGRLAATAPEIDSRNWLADYLRREADLELEPVEFSFPAWRGGGAALNVGATSLEAGLLVGTPPTPSGGVTARLVDVGRGTPGDFELAGDAVAGAIVLVRHEYMFTRGTVHRRIKYAEAIRRGAAGFVIGAHIPGIPMIGGAVSAADDEAIPAVAVGFETAQRLAEAAARGRSATLGVEAERGGAARAENLVLDLPGRDDGMVVLSAHIDGHLPAESALDNASGVAAAVAAAMALAPQAASAGWGLRLCIFTAEEWALTGSRVYLEEMDAAERARLRCNVNLDSVAGDPYLTALTSGFDRYGETLNDALGASGLAFADYLPLMPNSDHANFAAHAIPAARIVAGFDRPASNLRYVLTSADTRDKAAPAELKTATLATTQIVGELMSKGAL